MKFPYAPVHMIDEGPWGVDSTSKHWYVVHWVTLRAKRVGHIGAKRTNYFDEAVAEARRRNKKEKTCPLN